jgi:DNA-binding NarL/FixJ family response regulator
VAELAAGGLSNPEIAQRLFVSRKTVEAHLGSIYRKLDINSRQALGRVLADDPGAPA